MPGGRAVRITLLSSWGKCIDFYWSILRYKDKLSIFYLLQAQQAENRAVSEYRLPQPYHLRLTVCVWKGCHVLQAISLEKGPSIHHLIQEVTAFFKQNVPWISLAVLAAWQRNRLSECSRFTRLDSGRAFAGLDFTLWAVSKECSVSGETASQGRSATELISAKRGCSNAQFDRVTNLHFSTELQHLRLTSSSHLSCWAWKGSFEPPSPTCCWWKPPCYFITLWCILEPWIRWSSYKKPLLWHRQHGLSEAYWFSFFYSGDLCSDQRVAPSNLAVQSKSFSSIFITYSL